MARPIMARPIINADEHPKALSKSSNKCIAAVVRYVQVVRPATVHLYEQDIKRIEHLSAHSPS